jgi:hypothetical protein
MYSDLGRDDKRVLKLGDIPIKYNIIVTEDSMNPFNIDYEMATVINEKFKSETNEIDRAKAIFDWMVNNIDYDYYKCDMKNQGYKQDVSQSKDVFKLKKGVCGEMSYLYVVFARCSGLKANYVYVNRDCYGTNVYHACAGLFIDDPHLFTERGSLPQTQNKPILIDIAYKMFDVKHQIYEIYSDKKAVEMYKVWTKA